MPLYQVHGLRMRLPEAVSGFRELAGHCGPDIDVVWAGGAEPAIGAETGWQEIPLRQRLGSVPFYRAWRRSDAKGPEYLWFSEGPERTLRYRIRPHQGRIEVWPNAEVPTLRLLRPVFGQALAFLLRAGGRLLLHAASARIADRAVLIAGPSGSGKSTLLHDLVRQGCGFLGDDMALIHFAEHDPAVHPGHGTIKLLPQSLSLLHEQEDGDWPLAAGGLKREVAVEALPPSKAVPVTAIFLLEPRQSPCGAVSLAPVSSGEALAPLFANIHPAYLPIGALDPGEAQSLFVDLSNLAARTAVYRVERPDALDALPQASRRIIEAVTPRR